LAVPATAIGHEIGHHREMPIPIVSLQLRKLVG
jgi:hypothetical protein